MFGAQVSLQSIINKILFPLNAFYSTAL